jgi:hypothetical protein
MLCYVLAVPRARQRTFAPRFASEAARSYDWYSPKPADSSPPETWLLPMWMAPQDSPFLFGVQPPDPGSGSLRGRADSGARDDGQSAPAKMIVSSYGAVFGFVVWLA